MGLDPRGPVATAESIARIGGENGAHASEEDVETDAGYCRGEVVHEGQGASRPARRWRMRGWRSASFGGISDARAAKGQWH